MCRAGGPPGQVWEALIYMLSQCKDALDNPAALFARMARITRRELSVRKIWILADIRVALTNQELALAVTSLSVEAENPKQQWRKKVVACGYPELYIHLRTFTKTGIHFATRLELPGRSPSHDAYSRLLCSEFHARMKRVNSKCSSVQLRIARFIHFIRVWC